MRVLFAGTPHFAVPSLDRLAQEFELGAVLTAPDKPAGRGRKLTPSPVKARAQELGLPVLQPERLGSEARSSVTPFRPTLLVCVAYGQIFGPKFLNLFPSGGINLHPSLLPRFRGPAPIPATILAGDGELGITVQELALEMDSGDIYVQERVALDGSESAGELTEFAAHRGAELVAEAVRAIAEERAAATPQRHDWATYCSFLQKEDGEIDFNRPAEEIQRKVRAYNPWPGAFTFFDGQRLTIHRASVVGGGETAGAATAAAGADPAASGGNGGGSAVPGSVVDIDKGRGILVQTGDGLLAVSRLQLQGKKPLEGDAFANGHPHVKRAIFGR